MRLPLASLWAPLMVDSHDAATAPTLFEFKHEDSGSKAGPASQEPACRVAAGGAPTRRGGLQPSSVVPTVRPSASSRWGPSVVGMRETLPPSTSSAFGGQAERDGVEDVRLEFAEAGRPAVLVRNFKPAAAGAGAKLGPQHAAALGGKNSSRALIATSARRIQPVLPKTGISAPPALISNRAIPADGAVQGDPSTSMLSHLKGLMEALDSGSGTTPLLPAPGDSSLLLTQKGGKPNQSTSVSSQQKKPSYGRAVPSVGQYASRGPTGSLAQSLRDREHWVAAAAAATTELQASFEAPRVAMWAHVPGSKVYEGLFPAYTLPSGSGAFMYR